MANPIKVSKKSINVAGDTTHITDHNLLNQLVTNQSAAVKVLSDAAGHPLNLQDISIDQHGVIGVKNAQFSKGLAEKLKVLSEANNGLCGAGC
jgi:hypothetical protein